MNILLKFDCIHASLLCALCRFLNPYHNQCRTSRYSTITPCKLPLNLSTTSPPKPINHWSKISLLDLTDILLASKWTSSSSPPASPPSGPCSWSSANAPQHPTSSLNAVSPPTTNTLPLPQTPTNPATNIRRRSVPAAPKPSTSTPSPGNWPAPQSTARNPWAAKRRARARTRSWWKRQFASRRGSCIARTVAEARAKKPRSGVYRLRGEGLRPRCRSVRLESRARRGRGKGLWLSGPRTVAKGLRVRTWCRWSFFFGIYINRRLVCMGGRLLFGGQSHAPAWRGTFFLLGPWLAPEKSVPCRGQGMGWSFPVIYLWGVCSNRETA